MAEKWKGMPEAERNQRFIELQLAYMNGLRTEHASHAGLKPVYNDEALDMAYQLGAFSFGRFDTQKRVVRALDKLDELLMKETGMA